MSTSLPLEGGGKRVGVKGLTGIAEKFRKNPGDTPHPDPLPQETVSQWRKGAVFPAEAGIQGI
jgi:hypothetical protein